MTNSTEQDHAPVTVIGLGPMGLALAGAFLDHGHTTTVWNRSPRKADDLVAKGAHRAETVTDAVTASSVLVVCVKDYEAMYGILGQAGDALAGRTLINLGSGTPEEAREAVAWAAERGIHYLDGAIMVPPFAVGNPEAVFLYSGSKTVFDAQQATLSSVGGTTFLGDDPILAVLYNTALLGLMYSTLNGYLHAAALVGTAGVEVAKFAEIANGWFLPSVVNAYLGANAAEIDKGEYSGAQGSMEMNLTALEHIVRSSEEQGADAELPRQMKALAERAISAGYGPNSYMAVIELFKKPAGNA
ncbi:NAD(P)-binding domain-containing protein [Streptomyces sp. NPDC046215]|uniref:NAD(P)-binding domain-containing protein n=1 Tax=Streptomyces stramineus TaxID=173861 RepID=A0ABP3JCW8_9ACTN